MKTVITLTLAGLAPVKIEECDDCPMFTDPSWGSCYCELDLADGAPRIEVLGNGIPSNCPLRSLQVLVQEQEES